MGIIRNKLNHIINFNINAATRQAIERNKDAILSLNKQQLDEGLNAIGGAMPKYKPTTVKVKAKRPIRMPIPTNQSYNLRLTGKMHSQMFLTAESTSFDISSSDPRLVTKLQQSGGKTPLGTPVSEHQAFGLTQENKDLVAQNIVKPHLIRILKQRS